MHEAAITEALIEQVLRLAPAGSRLLACRVEVGVLEHLDAGVLEQLWRVMAAERGLADAALVVKATPLEVRCGECGLGYEPEDRCILVCPGCGSARPEILSGVGVVLRSIEVEEGG